MIPNIVNTIFKDIVEKAQDENTRKNTEEALANYFGQPKSETEDDADEIIVLENPDEL